MRPVAVVALGGHSLLPKGEQATVARQFRRTAQSVDCILASLGSDYNLVLTHGNGPQVGNILIRSERAAREAYPIPLSVAVAQSAGEIGYILQQALHNRLRRRRLAPPVVTVLT